MLNLLIPVPMLIKILSRKNKSFRSLLDYIGREPDGQQFYWNLPHNATSEILEKEFSQNDTYRSKRAKNRMYHHILSFSAKDKKVITPELLENVLQEYIYKSGLENHLAFGNVHTDKDHIHWHLMSSQNAFHSKKGFRLSKTELKNLQIQMEEFTREKFPELKHSYAYTGKRNRTLGLESSKVLIQPTEAEVQMAKANRTTQKEKVIDHLKGIASTVRLSSDFEKAIQLDNRFGLYSYRDKIHGIVDKRNDKKYRLTTLFQTKDLTAIYRQLKSKHKELDNQRQHQQEKQR